MEIIQRAGLESYKLVSMHVDTQGKVSAHGTKPVPNPTKFRSLARALQYLTFTRPDITYVVQQVCLHMHDPRETHMNTIKRILWYLQGTASLGLHITKYKSNCLVAYTDADWAGCPDSRRSTSGYCVYLGDNILSWSSKRQAKRQATASRI
ncbi:uncharacterized mitochondrial protein AtMg00810-like [Rutidosis leptorrhynchoides]|uniref:uncharacterized mitochondrial protein AtMg00810-like n=1 Tax=Rutidosis leptorrhynchoides TaxID=125765 RepID=UPI003A997ED0